MITPPDDAGAPDPPQLLAALQRAHEQLAAACWLSAGMLAASAALACIALRWRRPALACGFAYALTLCFVRNGHAQVLGPVGCAVTLAGLLWPRRREAGAAPP